MIIMVGRGRPTKEEEIAKLKKKPILPYEGMKFPSDDEFFMPPTLKYDGKYHIYLHNICSKVKRCLPVSSAFKMQKLSDSTYRRWKKISEEEREKFKDTEFTTPLIMFFDAIYDAESNSEDALVDVMMTTAIDDHNTDSAKYLLDKRHKWKEVKGIEVDTDDDKSLEISITPMQDNFKENEEEEE